MNFAHEYEIRKARYERFAEAYAVDLLRDCPSVLREAMLYALEGGGKRLRPILLLEASQMFAGVDVDTALSFAFAVECIHTYSLIHDDLPCMDDDDMRRGRPTCHRAFGEANAVLAGDALLNLAYEIVLQASMRDVRFARAGRILAEASGGKGLIGGQVRDLAPDATAAEIDYIYAHKTGALICAALKAGAVLGGANEAEIDAIARYGEAFGYAFQLRDDLLDGAKDGENSYLGIYGKDKTERTLRDKSLAATTALASLPHAEFLRELTENFIYRTK